MAENEDLISSLYPPPPPYYKFFTQENKDKLEEWKKAQEDSATEGHQDSPQKDPQENQQKDTEPPGELRFLVPPTQPEGSHYRGYGSLWSFEDKLPSLEDLGWKRLYESVDDHDTSKAKIQELHKLMDSLLLCFLELIGTMSIEPLLFHVKIEDLKLILININHILNTYRPHQSRESLIMLLRHNIEEKRAQIADIDKTCAAIRLRIDAIVDVDAGQTSSVELAESGASRQTLTEELLLEI